jgi:poly-gamma-glutamate synthesis protein (capsule biosynthesis protein)
VAKGVNFPVVGAGADAAQAFAPYRTKIDGQRIAILAATQVIAANLTSTWTATSSQGGVASALNPTQLIRAVQAARRTSDTVVVYLYWGTETVACPDPQQEPLTQELVKAGADIVVGTGAHVLLGAGYLGNAYIDYGLGNLAFYDDTAPETNSGVLLITVEGRHVLGSTFRPATIVNGLPQPLTGTPAATAIQSWLEPFGHPDGHPGLREGGNHSLRPADHHHHHHDDRTGEGGHDDHHRGRWVGHDDDDQDDDDQPSHGHAADG